MSKRDEFQMMVQVSRLFYENRLNQIDIAERLGMTRQRVAHLLDEAYNRGVVRISIHDPYSGDFALAENLKENFNLHKVVLTSSEGLTNEQLSNGIGLVAARFLQETLKNGQLVGIGWGRTLFSAINLLTPVKNKAIRVVPIIGGIGNLHRSFQINDLARHLAESFGGTNHNFYAPAIVDDELAFSSLLKTTEIGQVLNLWNNLDVAIIGIGNVELQESTAMFFSEHISPHLLAQLREGGTVGDICGHFFDIEGRQVKTDVRVIGIDLDQLINIKEVIAIASGKEKFRAIYGALQGKYIKTLVTDTAMARALVTKKKGNL